MSMKKSSESMEPDRGSRESDQMPGAGSGTSLGSAGSGSMQSMPAAAMVAASGRSMPGTGRGGGMRSGGGMDGGGGSMPSNGGDTPRRRNCGTMEAHYRLLLESPAYARARAEIENQTISFAARGGSAQRPGITTIPVVVHVVGILPRRTYQMLRSRIKSRFLIATSDGQTRTLITRQLHSYR